MFLATGEKPSNLVYVLNFVLAGIFGIAGCEGRPKESDAVTQSDAAPVADASADVYSSDARDTGSADQIIADVSKDASDASDVEIKNDANDSEIDAAGQKDVYDAADAVADSFFTDADSSVDTDSGKISDASDAESSVDADTDQMSGCHDLQVNLDESSCVTDPRTAPVFGSELPRIIKIVGFTSQGVSGCPSRNVMLHAGSQPLFINLMADRSSIPLLQSNPDAGLSQLAEDFMNNINGNHNLVPADGFIEGAVGVWRPEPNPNSGPFILDALINGLNLTYRMPGYSCNYKASNTW